MTLATAPAPSDEDDDVADSAAPTDEEATAPTRRWDRDGVWRTHVWPLGLVYAAIATAIVLTNAPGRYVLDNRFEQYWNPGQRLARYLVVWDGTRGLGRAREEYWPGATIPIAVYRWLGAPPWLAEHLWHATLLTVAGVGMVMVVRLVRPRIDAAHVFAGLVYMVGPYSLTFLIPSNLYYHYALAPWFVVVTWRGAQSDRPWRGAAAFAVLIWSIGNLDTPGLMYTAVPVFLALLFLVLVERRITARHAVGWLARAAALSVLVALPALFKIYAGAGALAQRLESTETPEAIASASSWSESFRGLGLWLSYFRDSFGLNRPQGAAYFSSRAVVVATWVIVLVGVAGVWRLRDRLRLLFAGMLAVGTMLMVGAFPAERPSPYGRVLLFLLDTVPSLTAIRATYKAGAGYAIGVAALFGLTVAAAHRRVAASPRGQRSRVVRAAPLSLAGLTVLLAAWPAWHGDLYDPVKQLDEVPEHWTDALAWIDAQPGDTRVMFVPGTTRSPYRWGWPGDDIHDALMDRPHVLDIAITLSNPLGTDIIAVLDDSLADGRYIPGTFAPIARRLGIEYLVLRNDLDWRITASPRPSLYDDLRSDPDLTLVTTFGEPGEGTTAADDGSDAADAERELPPIEVYRISDPRPIARVGPPLPWHLVSGNGNAWVSMADAGLLDGGNPIVYTADLETSQLTDALDEGAGVIVTDTNQRRALAVQTYNSDLSAITAADQELERPAEDLFAVPGSQTVAWYEDARYIEDTGLFRPLDGFRPQFRPAMAFDGDSRTGWVAPEIPEPETRSLRIEFREPQTIDEIEIDQLPKAANARDQAGRSDRIVRADLRFSDGSVQSVNFPADRDGAPSSVEAELDPVTTTSVEIDIQATSVSGGIGIAEVRFPGLDLDTREHLQVPDDLFRAADADPALAEALADAPTMYRFDRLLGSTDVAGVSAGQIPEEVTLRRRFRTDERTFTLLGLMSSTDSQELLGEGCRDLGLRIDDEPVEVRVDLVANDRRTPFRSRVRVEACEPIELDAGWHRLESTEVAADRIVLTSGDLPIGGADEAEMPTLDLVDRALPEAHYRVDAADGGFFVSGDAYAPVWRASLDGEPLGPPVPADAQNAWVLPADTDGTLRVWTPAQRRLDLAVTVSVVTLAACVWLLVRPRRPV